jgi:uncharacterized protein YodC (DUF2158 family)
MLIDKKKDELFFSPGDQVMLKQDLDNKPKMMVKSVDRLSELHEKPKLLGITCQWFNTNKELQTARFSTKDLIHIPE